MHWANKAIVLKLYRRQLCLVVKKHIKITIIWKEPALSKHSNCSEVLRKTTMPGTEGKIHWGNVLIILKFSER